MQTRRTIYALLASIAVFWLWMLIAQRIWPPATPTGPEASTTQSTTQPATSTAPAGTAAVGTQPSATTVAEAEPAAPATVGTSPATTTTTGAGQLVIEGGGDSPETIEIGSTEDGGAFPMRVTVTTEGASVTNLHLRGYYESVERDEPYRVCGPVTSYLDLSRTEDYFSFTTAKIRIENLGFEAALDRAIWKVEQAGENVVELSLLLKSPADQPVARLIKRYELPEQPVPEKPRLRTFDLMVSTRIENLTDGPIETIIVQHGPVGFRSELSRGEERKVLGAVWTDETTGGPKVQGHLRTKVGEKGQIPLGADETAQRVAWLAEENQYFCVVMAPAGRNSFEPAAPPIFQRADAISLTGQEAQQGEDVTYRYITKPLSIAPGSAADIAFDCYAGPKNKPIFQTNEVYQQRDYYQIISESFYFCAPGPLVALMMWLLNVFYAIPPHNYGIAIIILVLVVRGVLHPVTKKSQVNMMKMQKQMSRLQPKVQAAKEKHANDRTAMNNAIMEIYKEEGINPAGQMLTCMPMMLQIPIWAALWAALNTMVEMRHAPFDGWWIQDLTQPDALIPFGTAIHIPLLSSFMGGPITALNLLPIMLGISQVLQTRFMPRGNPSAAAASGNPDQLEQQRKMMMFMSVFFVFILYNAPSGLNLYIMSSNIFGIIEQMRIRKHIADEEARLEAEPQKPKPKRDPNKKSWVQRKIAQLEKEVEQAKRVQSDRKK